MPRKHSGSVSRSRRAAWPIAALSLLLGGLGAIQGQTAIDGDNLVTRVIDINNWNMFTSEQMAVTIPAPLPAVDKIVGLRVLLYSDNKSNRKPEVYSLVRMPGYKNNTVPGQPGGHINKTGGSFVLNHNGTSLVLNLSRGKCIRDGSTTTCAETRAGSQNFFTFAGIYGSSSGSTRTFKAAGLRGRIILEALP